MFCGNQQILNGNDALGAAGTKPSSVPSPRWELPVPWPPACHSLKGYGSREHREGSHVASRLIWGQLVQLLLSSAALAKLWRLRYAGDVSGSAHRRLHKTQAPSAVYAAFVRRAQSTPNPFPLDFCPADGTTLFGPQNTQLFF